MPVYEYQCKSCNREFEYQQRMSDPDRESCEVCGGALERLISRTAFTFKGGGWYKDLYASAKPESKSAEGAAAPAGSGDAGSAAPSGSSSAAPASGSSGSAPASSGSSSSGSAGGSASGSSGGSSAAGAKVASS